MSSFNVAIISPRGFQHSAGFREVADSTAWALCALGHEANVTQNWISKTERNIIFGAELLAPNQPEMLPPGTIIFQLEQPSHPNLAKVQGLVQMCTCTVWDYSLTNVRNWRQLGADVRHVPIGFTPNLCKIPKADVQDIDVLFLGWITPRRQKILEDLKAAGLKVVASQNCYGGGRDNLISRAKVCLNVHHDGRNLFEIVRVSYYLANKKCVVSESSEDDLDYADIFGYDPKLRYAPDLYCMVPREAIVESCLALANMNEDSRACFENAGFRNFSKRDFTATIQAALNDLSPSQKAAQRFAEGSRVGDMKDFMGFLKEKARGTCLEIGVRDGASTSALLSGVEANGGVVMSLDVEECGHLFSGHPQWKFIKTSSQNPKLHFPELDLLLIDGDHTRFGYRADLDRYFPLVKPGGLILSHDIDPDPSLTLEALPGSDRPSKYLRDEYFAFAEHYGLEHYELPGTNGMGVMVKGNEIIDDQGCPGIYAAPERVAIAK